jgi:hypothetical protein
MATELEEGNQALHLRGGKWHRIAWDRWMKFRGFDGFEPLEHVGQGEHFFVVCIVEDGRLYNVMPHRYLIDRDGRIAHDRYFGVLSDDEISQFEALNRRHYEYPQTEPLSSAENSAFSNLRERLWRSWLPPIDAARELTRAATALPDEDDAAWHFLEAGGLTRGTSRKPS